MSETKRVTQDQIGAPAGIGPIDEEGHRKRITETVRDNATEMARVRLAIIDLDQTTLANISTVKISNLIAKRSLDAFEDLGVLMKEQSNPAIRELTEAVRELTATLKARPL
jgi:hypothetical protein